MGFGTLFIGYFLLLNLTYASFTNVIAAAIMLLAFYKLSPVNQYFKYAVTASTVFLVFSLVDFGIGSYEMFMQRTSSALLVSVLSVIRCAIVGTLTVIMLRGIEEVAKEVDLDDTPTKAHRMAIASMVTYALWIALEAPLEFMGDFIPAVISVVTVLATIALLIVNLTIIYSCYMRICMPGNEDYTKDKPSRFTFVNEYRARKQERAKAEAKARLDKLKERNNRKKGNK